VADRIVIGFITTVEFYNLPYLRRGLLPVPFIFIPATLVSYLGLPPGKSNAAAGLLNFMRNIGSGVGTSLVVVMLTQGSQFHQTMLASHASMGDPAFLGVCRRRNHVLPVVHLKKNDPHEGGASSTAAH